MKVVLTLIAVFFVLLDRSISVGGHRPHHPPEHPPNHPPEHPPEHHPQHPPQRPPHTPPANAPNDDIYIPAIADELFTAIFNPSEFPAVSVGPINDAQGCVNAYNRSTLIAVGYAGVAIRHAVIISESGLHINNFDQLREQFVQNINRCSTLEISHDRFKCYESEITDMFQRISTENHSHGYIYRPKILAALKKLAKNLAREFEILQVCLAQFSGTTTISTTPETQASSDTTTSIGVTSSEPQTSSDTATTVGVSSTEPQTTSETTTTSGVSSSEPQTTTDSTTSIGVSSSEPQTSSDTATTVGVSSTEPQTTSGETNSTPSPTSITTD